MCAKHKINILVTEFQNASHSFTPLVFTEKRGQIVKNVGNKHHSQRSFLSYTYSDFWQRIIAVHELHYTVDFLFVNSNPQ